MAFYEKRGFDVHDISPCLDDEVSSEEGSIDTERDEEDKADYSILYKYNAGAIAS